mmetsp:Transcript_18077/g.31468  ORF Transcript_18077/g.31468 Transcript_18077/m.31468 type:complete len:111 (-) Transcript_18077:1449-1781(-)|eukprot:CAMPEP_0174288576 /NCGR_PEP_ID=MMETSP0809-20121228/21342_1 /TAXON_ID=73025 ORGANISM="Eutreptiella gymnastica-like, Strain CCMP1594" /NCGR_SAMPLE_ID=MMETSP0809 /ASSEMBLY_ACC=CAM_ASM_000658 /LENGTH=110 /DNA_ID=CAMNT_0015385887 /DNA_START=1417 /DNA_END=1749 /DNA_ORIENTATION=-
MEHSNVIDVCSPPPPACSLHPKFCVDSSAIHMSPGIAFLVWSTLPGVLLGHAPLLAHVDGARDMGGHAGGEGAWVREIGAVAGPTPRVKWWLAPLARAAATVHTPSHVLM